MSELSIVIFGVTGNLSEKKLIPALFELWKNKNIPEDVSIFGLSHRSRSQDELKTLFEKSLKSRYAKLDEKQADDFWKKFYFMFGDLSDNLVYKNLKEVLDKKKRNIIYYLATLPTLYQNIFENLDKENLNKNDDGFVKIMVEKPIGNDLVSAKKLNKLLRKHYLEKQIFRIDHYLAKDTIQNILAFRFHNSVFESVWKKDRIDHIQITVAESFGAEFRGAYYDSVGALKDVGQNHVLQMLAFITMGRPRKFDNKEITSKRLGVLRNLVALPKNLVLGQYEDYSDRKINTNTFFAFKTYMKSGKFKNVPVYLRGGKKLAKTVAEISIVFKGDNMELANTLTFRIQPNEGIVFRMAVKKPGLEMNCERGTMQFCYSQVGEIKDAYVRLLMDAIVGEQTFFNDAIEVEAQWKFIDSLGAEAVKVSPYKVGTWGPKESDELIRKDGREWLVPSEDLCQI
ncbi:MAG: glucose-6-phosphate dehydrogenase [Candidatus Shapirobacteria bacterium]